MIFDHSNLFLIMWIAPCSLTGPLSVHSVQYYSSSAQYVPSSSSQFSPFSSLASSLPPTPSESWSRSTRSTKSTRLAFVPNQHFPKHVGDIGQKIVATDTVQFQHSNNVHLQSKRIRRESSYFPFSVQVSSSSSDDNYYNNEDKKQKNSQWHGKRRFVERVNEAALQRTLSNIFSSDSDGGDGSLASFVPLGLAGRCQLQMKSSSTKSSSQVRLDTLLLSTPDQCKMISDAYQTYQTSIQTPLENRSKNKPETNIQAMSLPLSPSISSAALRLLDETYHSSSQGNKQRRKTLSILSKTILLSLHSLIVNRDNGLFDNLPWSTWSIDPELKERDAVNNVVEEKYTMGKRRAYWRMMGRDWGNWNNWNTESGGRSLAVSNLFDSLQSLLAESKNKIDNDKIKGESNGDDGENAMMVSLSKRLLQLEMKEARMYIAECEQNLAVARMMYLNNNANDPKIEDDESDLDLDVDNIGQNEEMKRLDEARSRLQVAESSLQELLNAENGLNGKIETKETLRKNGGEDLFSAWPFSFWNNKSHDEIIEDKTEEVQDNGGNGIKSLIVSILDKFESQTEKNVNKEQSNPVGSTNSKIAMDSSMNSIGSSGSNDTVGHSYYTPYDLLIEIIQHQLNSRIIACVLEPSSLLESNLVLGGALLLERRGITKTTSIDGEVLSYVDDDEDLGNTGVLPRSMYLVECYSDEAVGVAMALGMPVYLESKIWERVGQVPVEVGCVDMMDLGEEDNAKPSVGTGGKTKVNQIPSLRPLEGYPLNIQLEGEKVSSEEEANGVRIPLTTSPSLFDGPYQVPYSGNVDSGSSSSTNGSAQSESSTGVFSTFNPVKSLQEYDSLSNDEKVRVLLKLDSFRGMLPRPRVVQSSIKSNLSKYKQNGTKNYSSYLPPPSILDDLLLPLIDESIRRQYLVRDAERRNDLDEANALRAERSPRQKALEMAEAARQQGEQAKDDSMVEEAKRLEQEAEFYKSLRADFTQDEGSYSRFLDRDEWYERETQARIARLKKKQGLE